MYQPAPTPWPSPVTLEGTTVRLEPLAPAHAEDLTVAGADESIWRYMPAPLTSRDLVERWIATSLGRQRTHGELPFAIVHRATSRAIGSTRYLNVFPADRGLEIGWTWLSPLSWRSAVNTECKFLLLRHAFEALGAARVQLKADARNERSRRAIERIGATFEGILRRHVLLPDGTYRDSAFYSVIDTEWPAVREALAARTSRPRPTAEGCR